MNAPLDLVARHEIARRLHLATERRYAAQARRRHSLPLGRQTA